MATLDISRARASDYTNVVDDILVAQMSTDGATDQKETIYTNSDWPKWWGYFNQIADLQSAILMKSIWNVGRGYETEDINAKITLNYIKGWGKDTFEDILFNMDVVRNIGGDSFAEIIRGKDYTGAERIINLKPLDPSTMSIVVDGKGIIIRYEQKAKTGLSEAIKKYKPNEIFHLTTNRLADQIHGISRIAAIEQTILADNENFTDLKKLMHHQVKPFILWKLKTDDPVKIQEIVTKIDKARNLGEDMFIPDDDDAVSYEIVQVNISSAVFEWRNDIRNKFYRHFGLPLVIFGSGGSTESGGKMEMFAHETIFNADQRYIERQVWKQLGFKIKLNSPVGLSQNLLRDEAKDKAQGQEIQPQDTSPAGAMNAVA